MGAAAAKAGFLPSGNRCLWPSTGTGALPCTCLAFLRRFLGFPEVIAFFVIVIIAGA